MDDSSIRDRLAIDRTILANERTALSYGRTALGLIGLAVLIYKFSDPFVGPIFGSLALAGAAAVAYFGFKSYRSITQKIGPDSTEKSFGRERLALVADDD